VVTVIQPANPDFLNIAFCEGTNPPSLQNTSPNGISGTWLPGVIDATVGGSYIFTPNAGECANPQTIQVTINVDTLVSVDWTVTNAFSNNQVITVLASDPGNYLYQLDFGPLQTSNIFQNVGPGIHSISVFDANGCSAPISVDDIIVVDYPTYFTPNGDNYHDNWNVIGVDNRFNAQIYIFDRYGKLLKQINPTGPGWDGTYNGQPMPSSDYWFSIDYLESGKNKVFRAHFSLKR